VCLTGSFKDLFWEGRSSAVFYDPRAYSEPAYPREIASARSAVDREVLYVSIDGGPD
jgi:hypothetical protein